MASAKEATAINGGKKTIENLTPVVGRLTFLSQEEHDQLQRASLLDAQGGVMLNHPEIPALLRNVTTTDPQAEVCWESGVKQLRPRKGRPC